MNNRFVNSKYVLPFLILSLLSVNVHANEEQLSGRLWVNLDNSKIAFNSNYLTYQAVKFENQDGKESVMTIIPPAKRLVSLPKWGDPEVFSDGSFLPSWNWVINGGIQKNGSQNGKLKYDAGSAYGQGWQNGTVNVYGSSVKALFSDERDEGHETPVTLSLLNTMRGIDIATEIVGKANRSLPEDSAKLNELVKKLKEIQSYTEDAKKYAQGLQDFIQLSEMSLDLIEVFTTYADLSQQDKDAINNARLTLNHTKLMAGQLISTLNLGGVNDNVFSTEQNIQDLNQYILKQENAPKNLNRDNFIEYTAKLYAKEYNTAESQQNKNKIMRRRVISFMGKVSDVYENQLRQQIRDADNPSPELKKRMRIARNGAYLIDAITLMFAYDDSECAKNIGSAECQEQTFRGLSGMGTMLVLDILDLQNGLFADSEALQKYYNKFISGVGTETLTGKFKILASKLQLAEAIANKALPYSWDMLIGTDNYAVDIVNGQLSAVGVPVQVIKVAILDSSGKISRVEEISPNSNVKNEKIYLNNGETWRFSYQIVQPKLFDKRRALWEKQVTASQPLYNYTVNHKQGNSYVDYKHGAMCIDKGLFSSTNYAYHEEKGINKFSNEITEPPNSNGKFLCDGNWFQTLNKNGFGTLPNTVTERKARSFHSIESLLRDGSGVMVLRPELNNHYYKTGDATANHVFELSNMSFANSIGFNKTITLTTKVDDIKVQAEDEYRLDSTGTFSFTGSISEIIPSVDKVVWNIAAKEITLTDNFTKTVSVPLENYGNKTASVTIYGKNGKVLGSDSKGFFVRATPKASFGISELKVNQGQKVSLNLSNNKPTVGKLCEYSIYIPNYHANGDAYESTKSGCGSDGKPVDLRAIDLNFSKPGTYFIVMAVTDSNGETDNAWLDVTVEAKNQPIASLKGTATEGVVGEPVKFVLSNSNAPDGNICHYWLITGQAHSDKDVQTKDCSESKDPVTLSPVSVTYDKAGTYTAELFITESNGIVAHTTLKIVIKDKTVALPKLTYELADKATVGQAYDYGISQSSADNTCYTYFNIDWGDGKSSSKKYADCMDLLRDLPTHSYTSAGEYTILFKLQTNDGQKVTKTHAITVGNATASSSKLTATGITKCGDYAYGNSGNHNNDLDCSLNYDSEGDPIPAGQDGHVQAGQAMSYTLLNRNGAECVKDNVTGLIWEQKTDDGGLRDTDNRYTWYNPDASTNGGSAGTQNGGTCTGSDCDTHAYIQALNNANYCGYSDWRMPTRSELVSIVDYGRYNPAINPIFTNTQSSWYWSASPNADGSYYAWHVGFSNGYAHYGSKGKDDPVRAVRSSQ